MNDFDLPAYFGGVPSLNVPLKFEWPCYTSDDKNFVFDTLVNKEFSYNQTSKTIDLFEEEFKDYIGSDYCLSLNSGTSALFVAFMTLGLEVGDEVLVPTYTFAATVMPLLPLGVKLVFVDCEIESSRISISDLKNKISPRTKAIVISHMDGIANDCKLISEIAKKNNAYLIEDCAQSLGAKIHGKHIGTWGDFGVFSLQQKKIVSAGEGGVLITNNRQLYEKAILFSYLQKRSFEEVINPELNIFANTGLGFNFRMHPIVAAMATTQLRCINENIQARRITFQKLMCCIGAYECLKWPQSNVQSDSCSYYTFRGIYFEKYLQNIPLELFLKTIFAEGIPIYKSTTLPLHLEPIFNNENASKFFNNYKNKTENMFIKSNLENSLAYSKSIFRISPYSKLSEKQLRDIGLGFKKVIQYFNNYI